MDAGIIAKIKAILRRFYGAWVVELTQMQIKSGVEPKDIKIPTDVPSCKKRLFEWLSQSSTELVKDKEGIIHCWAQTELLRAWTSSVQLEAVRKASDLFPNMTLEQPVTAVDITNTEDESAGNLGLAFTVPEAEDEWEGWVDWQQVGAAGSGSSDA